MDVTDLSLPTLISYPSRSVCLAAQKVCKRHFRKIESYIAPARWTPWESSMNWRFVERRPDQMLLQKLARQISGLAALDYLLLAGQLQEIGILYRCLDELGEDILFVGLALSRGDWTENHDRYATYFWSEDDGDRRPPVRRKTIRAFVNRFFEQSDPSSADAIGQLIHKTYSDYVHARSAPIMGMVVGPPSHFDLNGITAFEAREPYSEQHPAYFYRCLVSCSIIANAVLPHNDRSKIYNEIKAFEEKYSRYLFKG